MKGSKKRIVYFVAHPSQYYIYKNVANKLDNDFEIVLVYTSKDILNTLVQNDNLSCQFHEITLYPQKGFLYSIMNLLIKEFQLFKIVCKYKPQLLIGTSVVICHIGFILRKPSVIVNEDDIDVISLSAKLGYPFATRIVSPIICNLGYFEKKAIKYNGYQKLAYLHPNYFVPDIEIAKRYLPISKNNFLIRLSALSAHHDIGVKGIDNKSIYELISYLEKYGVVYISSERELPSDLQRYKLKLNPLHMHHVLSYVDLLISDSQSMSVEAAILGIPSIRISDFSGKISVLEELEHKYQLTYGLKPAQFNCVLDIIKTKIFNIDNYKSEFQRRKSILIQDKDDVISFFVETISKLVNNL